MPNYNLSTTLLRGIFPDTAGNTYFVSSATGNASGDGSLFRPFDSLQSVMAASGLGLAAGDTIILLPGHSENIASSTALNLNVAGLIVRGMGFSKTNKPKLILTTATSAVITISAANVILRDVQIQTTIDELVKCFSITAAGVTLDGVDFSEQSTSAQAIQFLLTTAAATDLTIKNCRHVQKTAPTGNGYWIELVGADRAYIYNNYIRVKTTDNAASTLIGGTTTASLDIIINTNTLYNDGATSNATTIKTLAGSTGFAQYNNSFSTRTTLLGTIVLNGVYGSQNYSAHTANKNAILDPVADA